jgi:long-chain acyl-CoA synthetase
MTAGPVDVLAAADPVDAVLAAYIDGGRIALRTSGTTSGPRWVVRTAASWVDSFPVVSELIGLVAGSRMWLPGPLASSMNLFAAAHARWAGAEILSAPAGASHACVTPTSLARALDDAVDLSGVHVVVAGDRLGAALAGRAEAAGARVSHYYGAAELSFVAWGADDRLRAFPGVELEIRDGVIWARSPYLSLGYLGPDGPFATSPDGFATVGDRGRLAAGTLTVIGRGDAAVLTGGATVLVGDVEQALSSACGAEVIVFGVPHARLGQVVAAVLVEGQAVPAARGAARALAPAQQPRLWFSVPRWPVTAAGKVDRAAIVELAASGGLTSLRQATSRSVGA